MPETAPDVNTDPVGYCLWGLQHGSPLERGNAADMLRSCGADAARAVPTLADLLRRDEETNVRAQCAFALMEIAYSAPLARMQLAIAPLREALERDEDAEVRSLAAGALGAIAPADEEVVSALRRALQDEHAWVREAAQEALDQAES